MTQPRERRITSEELYHLILGCPACHAEITLDLDNDRQMRFFLGGPASRVPMCPVCDTPIDSGLSAAVRKFAEWYGTLKAAGQTLAFRLVELEPGDARG